MLYFEIMEKISVLLLNDSLDNITDTYGTRSNTSSYFAWLHILIISVVLFCGVFGNLFLLISTVNTQSLRNHTGALVMNLTIADLFVVITTLPFMINVAVSEWEWRHGRFLCEAVGFAENIFTTASSLTIALISYERYLTIVKSFESQTHRTAFLVLLVWLLASLNGTLPIIRGSGYGFSFVTHTCTVSWHAVSFEFTCVLQTIRFFAPLVILTYSYGRIILVARKARKQVCPAVGNQQPAKISSLTDDTSLDVELASESQTSVGSSANEISSQSCDTNAVTKVRTVRKNKHSARKDDHHGQTSSTAGYEMQDNDAKPVLDVHRLTASQRLGESSFVGQENLRASYNMVSALSGLSQQPSQSSNDNPSLLFELKMNILRRSKASSTLFILVGVFLVCWVPYVFLTFRMQGKQYSRGNLSTTIVLLALANSSINVFLYGLTNTKYRREVQNCLKNCLSLNRLKTSINIHINQVHVATISRSIARSRKESRTKYISQGVEIPLGSDLKYGRAEQKSSSHALCKVP